MADRNMDADIRVEFSEAAARLGLNSGDQLAVMMGIIAKWLADMKKVCFSGDADTVGGMRVSTNGEAGIPVIHDDYGVLEVGKYIDFHSASGQDYDGRIVRGDGMFWLFNADNTKATIAADIDGSAKLFGGYGADLFIKALANDNMKDGDFMAVLASPSYDSSYETYVNAEQAAALGLSPQGDGGYWRIFYSRQLPDMGYGTQIAIPMNEVDNLPKFRKSSGAVWNTSWQNFADRGNAASVGTYTEDKIAALEARVAALEKQATGGI